MAVDEGDEKLFTASQIAPMVNRTKRAICDLGHRRPEFAPQRVIRDRRRDIHFFTAEQVEGMREFFASREGRGRQPLWTLSESLDRTRRARSARWHESVARRESDPERVLNAELKAKAIRADLARQLALRTDTYV